MSYLSIFIINQINSNFKFDKLFFRIVANNLIDCARWVGNLHKVLTTQRALIDKFPEKLLLQNDFGLTFLQMGRVEDARKIFLNVIFMFESFKRTLYSI